MIPVRNVDEFTREGNRITLHVPKFRSQWMRKWLIPPRRSTHFRVHLDETGSRVWDLIDGIRDTGEICSMMEGNAVRETSELDHRVTEFLRQLYKSRLIRFK